MIIKPRTYHTCPTCENKRVATSEVFGCNGCRKPIDMNQPERAYLSATVFHHSEPSHDLHFCSWKCAAKALRKVKTNYFVSLPYLHYGEKQKGLRAQDFFNLLKPNR